MNSKEITMEAIRVLHVVPNMHRAGLETFIMNVYRNIDREKIQFDFIVHYKERFDYDDEIEALGGKIYRLSVREDNNFLKYIKELNAFFSKHKEYRILHGHMESFGFIYSKIASKHGIKTIIGHSHNAFITMTPKGFIKYFMNKPWKYYITELFACSDKAGRFMFPRRKFSIIINGIDCNQYSYNEDIRNNYRNEFNINNKTVIGHVGRFETQKNHKFIIDIFNEYKKLDENSVLILVGEGSLLENTKAKVKQLKLKDSVYFLGVRNDMANLYQMFDIFILPSLFEGLPVVGVEAQAAGLPLLVSSEVTSELCITDLVYKYSLEASALQWCEEIQRILRTTTRQVTTKALIDAEYDIKDTATCLQNFYINKVSQEKHQKNNNSIKKLEEFN